MAFIVGTVYRSNLKAMLILPKLHLPFNNIDELSESGLTVFAGIANLVTNAITVGDTSRLREYLVHPIIHVLETIIFYPKI